MATFFILFFFFVLPLAMAPILFWIGGVFVFYLVIPKAWHFFLSFEVRGGSVPLVLEARISEYLGLVTQLIVAFGLAFELPVIFAILTLMGVTSAAFLQRKRRPAIVINFIIAGLITPPDVLSQIALALPMLCPLVISPIPACTVRAWVAKDVMRQLHVKLVDISRACPWSCWTGVSVQRRGKVCCWCMSGR